MNTRSIAGDNRAIRLRLRAAAAGLTRPGVGSQAAFTMVEIALCIAVVAFALVAIIGVLPTGMQVQRDNREDTIINQDGKYWLECIRGGVKGLNELTNYVQGISVYRSDGATVSYANGTWTNSRPAFTNGYQIVGLLSTPKYLWVKRGTGFIPVISSNQTFVRALSGSAAEKSNGAHEPPALGFGYMMTVELTPYTAYAFAQTNFQQAGLTRLERANRQRLYTEAQNLATNLMDLRLTLNWPVFQGARGLGIGNRQKVFRTLVSGTLLTDQTNAPTALGALYFVQPSSYSFAL